jgi:hypothetical protein
VPGEALGVFVRVFRRPRFGMGGLFPIVSTLQSPSGCKGAVHRDDPRPRMAGSLQNFLEELLGRSRVTFHGKPKINGSARGIDSTVQVPPVSALANVRFVDFPGAVGRFQFAPTAPVQFRGVALHPAPNGRDKALCKGTHRFPRQTGCSRRPFPQAVKITPANRRAV